MPLLPGRQNVSRNIRRLMHEGYPQRQAIAIAMREAGIARPRIGEKMDNAIEETVFHLQPAGVSFKGRVHLEGDHLIGELWVQYAGLPPRKITATVDMRAIVDALKSQASSDPEISGLFDFVKKGVKSLSSAAKSIGRNKLVKGLSRGVKSVIRSPATGAILNAAAVAFPPVGLPAAAAYQGAHAALSALDKRGNVLKKLGVFASKGAASFVPGMPPGVAAAAQQLMQHGQLTPALLRAAEKVAGPGAARELAEGQKAVAMIKQLGHRARGGDKRAAMQAAILRRVQHARRQAAHANAQLMALRQQPVPMPRAFHPFTPSASTMPVHVPRPLQMAHAF